MKKIQLPSKAPRKYSLKEVIIIIAIWSLLLIAVMDWLTN